MNASSPSPVGSAQSKLVSWTTAGLPDARYVTVRSLNQPLRVSAYCSFATENSPADERM